MKYKVGDKVRLHDWNYIMRKFGNNSEEDRGKDFISYMQKHCGKVVTICGVRLIGQNLQQDIMYQFTEDELQLYWQECMFETIK